MKNTKTKRNWSEYNKKLKSCARLGSIDINFMKRVRDKIFQYKANFAGNIGIYSQGI